MRIPIRRSPPRRSRGPQRRHHGDRPFGLSNQVNNVLGFPFLFARLDVRASQINMEMKIAAARALAALAREDVPTRSRRSTERG